MKKLLSIIFLSCLCLHVFASCNEGGEKYVSEISKEGFVLDNLPEDEGYVYFDHIKPPDNARPESKTIAFNGKDYTSTRYMNTENDYRYGAAIKRDYYYARDGVSFALETGTDRLVYFGQSIDIRQETALGDTSSLTVAQEIAKQYLGDPSLYDLKTETLYVSENGIDYGTKYTYTKRALGYSTTDFLCVSITNSGKIYELSIGQTGVFDALEEFDKSKVEESIKDIIYSTYEKDGAKITGQQPRGSRLVVLENGKIVLASNYYIWIKDGNGLETLEHSTVLTYIE